MGVKESDRIDASEARVRCISDIVGELVKASHENKTVNLNRVCG